MPCAVTARVTRATLLRGMAMGGATLGLVADFPGTFAATSGASGFYDFQNVLTVALIAEQLAATFYYTALTSRDLMSVPELGGSSIDPNHPGVPPNGTPANVRFLQAALDAEVKHATALLGSGAIPTYTHYYFPATTFTPACTPESLCTLGSPGDLRTFLGVQAALETAFVGAYLAAIEAFIQLGHPHSAALAANILAVESEHLFAGRAIAGATPANDLALQATPFAQVSDAATALRPFLTGTGFPDGATAAIPVPSAAQIAPAVGRYSTRIVARFL